MFDSAYPSLNEIIYKKNTETLITINQKNSIETLLMQEIPKDPKYNYFEVVFPNVLDNIYDPKASIFTNNSKMLNKNSPTVKFSFDFKSDGANRIDRSVTPHKYYRTYELQITNDGKRKRGGASPAYSRIIRFEFFIVPRQIVTDVNSIVNDKTDITLKGNIRELATILSINVDHASIRNSAAYFSPLKPQYKLNATLKNKKTTGGRITKRNLKRLLAEPDFPETSMYGGAGFRDKNNVDLMIGDKVKYTTAANVYDNCDVQSFGKDANNNDTVTIQYKDPANANAAAQVFSVSNKAELEFKSTTNKSNEFLDKFGSKLEKGKVVVYTDYADQKFVANVLEVVNARGGKAIKILYKGSNNANQTVVVRNSELVEIPSTFLDKELEGISKSKNAVYTDANNREFAAKVIKVFINPLTSSENIKISYNDGTGDIVLDLQDGSQIEFVENIPDNLKAKTAPIDEFSSVEDMPIKPVIIQYLLNKSYAKNSKLDQSLVQNLLTRYNAGQIYQAFLTSELTTPALIELLKRFNRLKEIHNKPTNPDVVDENLPSIKDEFKKRLNTVAVLLTPLEFSILVNDVFIVKILSTKLPQNFITKFSSDPTQTKHGKYLDYFTDLRRSSSGTTTGGAAPNDPVVKYIIEAQKAADNAIAQYNKNNLQPQKSVDSTTGDSYYTDIVFNNVLNWVKAKDQKKDIEEISNQTYIEEAENDFKEGKPFNPKYTIMPKDKKDEQKVNDNAAKWYTFTYYKKLAEKQGKEDSLGGIEPNITTLRFIKNLTTLIPTGTNPQLQQNIFNEEIKNAYQDAHNKYNKNSLLAYTGFLDGVRAFNNVNYNESEWTVNKMVTLAEGGPIELDPKDVESYNNGYDEGLNSIFNPTTNKILPEIITHAKNMGIKDGKVGKRYVHNDTIFLTDDRRKYRGQKIPVKFDFGNLNKLYGLNRQNPANAKLYEQKRQEIINLSKAYEDAYKQTINPTNLTADTSKEAVEEIPIAYGGVRRLTKRNHRKLLRK